MKKQNQVQLITVNENKLGQRIDNFLLNYLKGVPKRMIYRIIRKGEVRINSCRINPQYKIQMKDLIRIPPMQVEKKKLHYIFNKLHHISKLTKHIIYEDEYLLILNKPSGIAVHGGSGINFGIIEALRALRLKNSFLELVHRLDRETSGILLIAKKRSSLKILHEQLRMKQVQKNYLVLVKGKWPSSIKIIKRPLLKDTLNNGKRIVKVNNNGKYSETHFKVEEYFLNSTLINARPITGRMHQIRVHLQHAGYPIACDNYYGDINFNQKLFDIGLKRLFLHARSLFFMHPFNGKKVFFNAPLDKQLKDSLIILRKQNQL